MAKMDNKVAIVTGAAAGIGRSIADRFLAEGAKVVYADIKEPAEGVEKLTHGEKTAFYQLDVSDPEQVKGLIRYCQERFGGLDVMVNNAGVVDQAMVYETDNDKWHRVININLNGVFYGIREAATVMREAGVTGAIVNVSSIAGQVGFKGMAAYCASKGGVDSLTKVSALDLASDNIRVNAVAPGPIETDMVRPLLEDEGFKNMIEQNLPLTPVGHSLGQPEDVAAAVLYLASDEAQNTTGQILAVDGGWTAR